MAVFEVHYQGNLRTECFLPDTEVKLETQAPQPEGQKKESFDPSDLFAISLASCILTVFAKEMERLDIEANGSKVSIHKIMSKDPRRIKKLHVTLICPHTIESSYVARIEKAVTECPVRKAIHPDIEQILEFQWGAQ